jgi:hypothetical protein
VSRVTPSSRVNLARPPIRLRSLGWLRHSRRYCRSARGSADSRRPSRHQLHSTRLARPPRPRSWSRSRGSPPS